MPMNNQNPPTDLCPGLSVIIPVFNSDAGLPLLIEKLMMIVPEITEDHEIILINDGSRDDSWEVIENMTQRHPKIIGINLMRNYGQHNALLCGIRAAHKEVIITMDDDLQNPPGEIPNLLKELEKGFDVVYGIPNKPQHGFWRNLASRITKLVLNSAIGSKNAKMVSPFRAFRTHIRAAFEYYDGPAASIDVLLAWGTTSFGSIPVEHKPREGGVSNYTFWKLVTHALDMMTGYSTVPLRLATLIGFSFTLFGMCVMIYVMISFLREGGSVPGFPFLASIISIFSGAQLFTLGIIGEYLARMHQRILKLPSYIIRDTSIYHPESK